MSSVQDADVQLTRNSHAPICRLPVEVLVKILRTHCSWKELMAMTWVCKDLKTLVESAHILWSAPPLAHWRGHGYKDVPDELTELFIRRSGSAPLTFSQPRMRGSHIVFYNAKQFSIIAEQLHRTKRLEVFVAEGSSEATAFMEHLNFGRPQSELLEELDVRVFDKHYDPANYLDITYTFCGGTMRALTSCTLSGVRVLGLPLAPSLQVLELSDAQCDYTILRADLLALENLKKLSITLLDLNLDLDLDDNARVESIALPHLTELDLKAHISCLSVLLDLLPDPQNIFKIHVAEPEGIPAPPSLDDPTLVKALSRVAAFYKKATGASGFATGKAFSRLNRFGRILDEHYIKLGHVAENNASEDDEPVASVFCHVKDFLTPSSYLSQITELVINLNESEDSMFRLHEDINLELFVAVESFTFENMNPETHPKIFQAWPACFPLRDLKAWLDTRTASGRPLALVRFRECPARLRPFVEGLRRSQVTQVQWDLDEAREV
jgi:hypothetical protein